MNYYLHVLKNYVNFDGRARRKEYWMFTLINFIFLLVAGGIDYALGLGFRDEPTGGPFYFVYAFATFLPSLAVSVRRLHDVGKSGWFILIALIPIVGGIWLLYLMVSDSQPGDNEYGPNPKEVTNENDPFAQPEVY